jgi:hypothetical protein
MLARGDRHDRAIAASFFPLEAVRESSGKFLAYIAIFFPLAPGGMSSGKKLAAHTGESPRPPGLTP